MKKRFSKFFRFGSGGFSLVEVMVAAGLASGVILTTVRMVGNNMKASKTLEATSDTRSMNDNILSLLGNPDACQQTLGGRSATSSAGITTIRDKNGTATFSTNDKVGTVTLSAISISSAGVSNPPVASDGGYTNLILVFDRGKQTYSQIRRMKIKLKVITDGSNNITNCLTAESGGDDIWKRTSSNPDDIYFSAGEVGIGTVDPQYTLDINGDIGTVSTTDTNGNSGIIFKEGARFLYTFENDSAFDTAGGNTFLGVNAGNLTMGNTASSTEHASYNTGVGHGALTSLTTGYSNTAIGQQAMTSNTSGSQNTALGDEALAANTTGTLNTAAGDESLRFNTTGSRNTAVGGNSLRGNSTGVDNTAVGAFALMTNSTGNYNTAVGKSALASNQTASNNTAYGYEALRDNSTGDHNTAFGIEALLSNMTGSYNTAYGAKTLYSNLWAAGNTAAGFEALYTNIAGSFNTSIGYQSMRQNNYGNENTAFGKSALYSHTTGYGNTAIGVEAANAMTIGTDNVAIGYQALSTSEAASNTTAIGYEALKNTTYGQNNVGIGYQVLLANSSGNNNVAAGHQAMLKNTFGYDNVALGYMALSENTGGMANTAVGHEALKNADAACCNTAIGNRAMGDGIVKGINNTAIGNQSLLNLTSGGGNIGIGPASLKGVTISSSNLAVGTYTGNSITTGNNNIAIGQTAMFGVDSDGNDSTIENPITGSDNVALGQDSLGATVGAAERNVMIGKSSGFYTRGSYNIGVGHEAHHGASGSTAEGNTAIGTRSMANVTAAYNNVGVGSYSLQAMTDGFDNVAFGHQALTGATSASTNVALGFRALSLLTTGVGNTAVGRGNLEYLTTGNYNVAMGMNTSNDVDGDQITTASYSIYLGRGIAPEDVNNTNEIIIGDNAEGQGDNTVQIGHDGITCFRVGVTAYTSGGACTSDQRLKKEIEDLVFGDELLKKFSLLRPVHYTYKKSNQPGTGFIAQEVEKIDPTLLGDNNEEGYKTVNYTKIDWMHMATTQQSIKELQKLQTKNAKLKQVLCEIHPKARICKALE